MAEEQTSTITEQVYARLRTVLDPETHINIVDMGFIYGVMVLTPGSPGEPRLKITYTLTTPGCPLASTLQMMIWDCLADLPHIGEDFEPQRHVVLDLTFDPPWTLGHLSDEARAELGF